VLNQQEGQVRAHQWTAEEKAALRAEVKPKAATTMSITVPLQSSSMVPPVPDVVTGLRNAVAVGEIVLEQHVRERTRSTADRRASMDPGASMHQHPD
jgi:hypothetical protein